MSARVLMAGGGTGGHIYPLVAISEELAKISPDIQTKFISVLSPKWRRYFSILNFLDLFKIPVGLAQAFFKVWAYMPDVIVTTGGYAAFLPLLAGRIFLIPIIICDLDSVKGAVNHFFGKRAERIFVAYESTAQSYKAEKTEIVGYPIRSEVLQNFDKAEAVKSFGFDGSKPVVFITTANQGAKIINDVISLGLFELTQIYHVIHQMGPKQFIEVSEKDYKTFAVMSAKEMALAYSACDVVVSRAGTVLFEIAAVGKPGIVIPLAGSAEDHQESNAREFAKYGGIVIEEQNLSQHVLLQEIKDALEKKDEISAKIKQFAKPSAAVRVAQEVKILLS